MTELVLAALIVLGAGFAHASTPLDAQSSNQAAAELDARWAREQSLPEAQRTILRDSTVETLMLSDGKTDCIVRPAHGTDSTQAECSVN